VIWNGLSNGTAATGKYAKWCGGEPNNSGNEDAAVTKWGGGNCWNDLPAEGWAGGIGGYVVEYEPTQTANPVHSDSMNIEIFARSIAVPTNLSVTFSGTNANLTWTAPVSGNTQVERYAVSWSPDNFQSSGWAISSTTTSATIPNLTLGTQYWFRVRADNDTLTTYSSYTESISGTPEEISTVVFSYGQTTVYQNKQIDTNSKTSLVAKARARNTQYGPDQFFVGIELRGVGGGLIYSHNTGWVGLTSSYEDIILTVNSTSVGEEAWALVDSATLVIGGGDSEFWAGNYGPTVDSASLKLDDTELMSNVEFSSGDQYWTSSVGWQACHATAGNKPCPSVGVYVAPTTTTTTVPPTFSGGGCGPYQQITVTGNTNSPVWGSNPYTDDSNFAAAAVHAGLISVGQTATLEPYWVSNYPYYGASTANGITTSEWGGSWCGYYIKLAGTQTPTSTTSTSTTVATAPQTTTTTEYATATTVGTIVPETTIPEETTTTTEPEEIEENEPDTATTSTSIPSPKEDTETTTPDTPDSDEPTDPQGSGETEQDNGEIPQESQDPVQESSDETTEENFTETEELIESITEATEEEAIEIIESIIKNIIEEKNVDELTEEDKEQITAVISAVIESGVSQEVAASLASEPAVLASIDVSQAEEIFSSVDEGELSEEQGAAIVEAVQQATEEIRGAFEEAINVFAGAFDTYVALGSTIDVGTRRSVIAVAALQATAGAAMAASSSGNIGGSSSSNSSPKSNSNPNDVARREEEEEEEAGEIEGTDLREWLDTISMWVYVNGIRKFSMKQLLKKFGYETAGIGFTISSTVILWVTLSGFTRTVAIIASLLAFAAHYYIVMLKKDE
jgi:hypothetical protein